MSDVRTPAGGPVLCLTGGVGGVKLVDGLAQVLPAKDLIVGVNTGDDFEHWGLWVTPDVDTVLYTLGGLSDDQRGWGLQGETFAALERMRAYGQPDWFGLGDRDLATHLSRTQWRREGVSLTAITARLAEAMGIGPRVLPMTDGVRQTRVQTVEHGELGFQQWLVRHRAPAVTAVRFEGTTQPSDALLQAIDDAGLVVLAPSNPYVSIDPILTLDGVARRLQTKPVVMVSPIVGGRAVKGPLAEMLVTLDGRPASAGAVVSHYATAYPGLVDAAVVELGDGGTVHVHELGWGAAGLVEAPTVMRDRADRAALARRVLQLMGGVDE